MVIISFFHLYKIHIFPKLGGCGSKNELATPFWILNFKWAWQAQFLSHNLLILQNCIFFVGKQMILVSFTKIHKGIKVTNFGHSCHIHMLSHPCPRSQNWSSSPPPSPPPVSYPKLAFFTVTVLVLLSISKA